MTSSTAEVENNGLMGLSTMVITSKAKNMARVFSNGEINLRMMASFLKIILRDSVHTLSQMEESM